MFNLQPSINTLKNEPIWGGSVWSGISGSLCTGLGGSLCPDFALSKGGMTGTVVDVRLLFAIALKATATAVIAAHNHPSGSLRPSEQDIKLTRKIKHGGQLLDIKIHDHLIVTEDGYFSFQDEGLM